MEFQYYGGNCISINTKGARLVIDDNLKDLGLKSITKSEDIALFTSLPDNLPDARLVFTDPGEYEASEISIFGVAARSHMDEKGAESATIFKIQFSDIRIAVIGHIHPDISEEYLEELGAIDILIIPVGGNGYTLDSVGALSIIKKIDPKIVIPTHYDDSGISYPVPQQPLSEIVKALDVEPMETASKFKPKPADYNETLSLVVVERT